MQNDLNFCAKKGRYYAGTKKHLPHFLISLPLTKQYQYHAVTFPFRLRLLALISSKMHSLVMHASSVAFLLLGSLTLEGPKALIIKSPCELIFFILLCQKPIAD